MPLIIFVVGFIAIKQYFIVNDVINTDLLL